MYLVKNVVKAMNIEKRKERTRTLVLATVLGVVSGVIIALVIAPKSDSINNYLSKIKIDKLY